VYASNVNKLFVFGGDDPATGIVGRYHPESTTSPPTPWSTGASMPDVRAFMASGYFNRQDLPGRRVFHR